MRNYTAPYEPQSTKRLHLLARLMYAVALIIFGRLLYLQIFKHSELKELAIHQQEQEIALREMRGTIFDSGLNPLAISVPVESVCVNPKRVKDPDTAAAILAKAIQLDETETSLRNRIADAKQAKRGFLWVKRKLPPEEAQTLHMLSGKRRDKNVDSGAGIDWIEFRTESKRVYPNGRLAGAVIGGLNEQEHGAYGLEHTLNHDLESVHGLARVIKDVRPTEAQGAFGAVVSTPAIPGKNIVITIDARIQYAAEQALARGVERTKATSGAVVVMDPKNGHILAMASYPGFDPTSGPNNSKEWRNWAMAGYEPGSAFKVVTYSSVFEHTGMSPLTPISCGNGSLQLYGHTFRDTHSFSVLAIQDAFAHSSNVAAINAARQVGDDSLYDMIKRFRFGEKTGIPLEFEEPGYVRPLKDWHKAKITLASAAIGYGLRTTTLQLAQAASVIANGGTLVAPQLIISTQRPGGPVEKMQAPDPVRIMRPETAFAMRRMMERVILSGTAPKAFLKIYTAGGKTGSSKTTDTITYTVKKSDGSVVTKKKTVYTASTYNGTFYGMAPLVDPSVAIAVTVNGGHGNGGFGGEAAAPVFKEVALAALRLRDVPKDVPNELPAPTPDDAGDLAVASVEGPQSDNDDFAFASVPSPQASSAAPAEAGGLRSFSTSKPKNDDEDPDLPRREAPTGPVVPNFQGKTLRDVLELASGIGLDIEPSGRGVARSQIPAPGQRITPGEKVKVQFAR